VYQENLRDLRWGMSEAVWRPPTDVYETDDSVVVVVEIAGLAEGDYTVTLSGRALLISGERRDPATADSALRCICPGRWSRRASRPATQTAS
jgi:HSP20 family molecular chaperone IbpA